MSELEQAHALIIEDDKSSVDVLSDLLNQLKVSYTVLYDSRKAVEVALSLPRLNFIFVDLEMPGSDGYQTLQLIRAQPKLQSVPIVAYTAHLSEMANARSAGFHSFLGKPLRSSMFADQVTAILKNQPVWAVR